MKKVKNKVIDDEIRATANTMAYSVQDMLDDIGRGGRFNFKAFEKSFAQHLTHLSETVITQTKS